MNSKKDSSSQQDQGIKEWIKAYIASLIEELHPQGDVLEIGFGSTENLEGLSANRIQSYHPKSHTIIESDPAIAEKAKIWAKAHSNVTVIQASWQTALPKLAVFDQIFFNEPSKDCEIQLMMRETPEVIAQTSIKAKELLTQLEEQMSQIKVSFSDKEIDDFFEETGRFKLKKMPRFLSKLKERKQITEKQYENAMKKYDLKEETQKSMLTDFKQEPGPLLLFLEECLEKHMRKGSRFTAFLTNTISKYEDSLFFDRIITNLNVNYTEKSIPLKIPQCNLEEALVIMVEKT